MRIRTFFLDQGETLGGAERFLIDFLSELSPSEFARISPGVVGAKLKSYQNKLPEKIKIFPFSFPSLKGGLLKKGIASVRLLSAAKRLKFLVLSEGNSAQTQVFANTPRTIFVAWLAKKVFRMKTRLIIMIHDFTIPKKLLRRIASTADVIVVNAMNTRQVIRDQIKPVDTKKIKIVENGIDFRLVKKHEASSSSQKIEKVVILGRIDPRKGQKYAVEAADLLQERNPHVQLFVVGPSFSGDPKTTAYERTIKKFAKERDLKNVFFLDEVSSPFEAFSAADLVLALPTEPETFGRVVIEALAMGKPVIAFDQTGPKQILESFARYSKKSADFFLVDLNNVMSLAEKIAFFADNPTEMTSIAGKARQFVFEKYNLKETKKQLWHILTET